MRSERVDELEILVRQLPGVSCVTFTERGGVVTLQVLLVDPSRADEAVERAELLAKRYLSAPVDVVGRVAGVTAYGLALEERVRRIPGVRHCNVERGNRGEVLRIRVSIDVAGSAGTVRDQLDAMLGTPLAPTRLLVDVEE